MISASIAAAGKEFSQSGKKKARYTFTSPKTGKKYRWTKATDPTDEDIRRLIELDNEEFSNQDLVAAANRNLGAAVARDKAARPTQSPTGAQVLGQGLRGMAKDISNALLPIENAARDNFLSALLPGNAASLLLRGKPILNLKDVLPKEAAPVIDALRPSSLVTDPMDVAGQFLVDPKQAAYDQFGKAFDPNAPALDRILAGLNIAGLLPGAYGAVKGIQKIAKGAKKGAKVIETAAPAIEDAEKAVKGLFRNPKLEYQNRLGDINAAEQNGLILPDDAEELRRKLRAEFDVPEPVAQVAEPVTQIAPQQVEPVPEIPLAESKTEALELPRLPNTLKGAKPRYGYGNKQFTLDFESDLDKAVYILAQKTRSKADEKYLNWAMQATGMDEASLRQAGETVRSQIKGIARTRTEGGEIVVPSTTRTQPTPTTKVAPVTSQPVVPLAPQANQSLDDSVVVGPGFEVSASYPKGTFSYTVVGKKPKVDASGNKSWLTSVSSPSGVSKKYVTENELKRIKEAEAKKKTLEDSFNWMSDAGVVEKTEQSRQSSSVYGRLKTPNRKTIVVRISDHLQPGHTQAIQSNSSASTIMTLPQGTKVRVASYMDDVLHIDFYNGITEEGKQFALKAAKDFDKGAAVNELDISSFAPVTSQPVVPAAVITTTPKQPAIQPLAGPTAAPNRAAASNLASQNIRDEFELGPLPEPERRRWETVAAEARSTYNSDAIDAKIADPTSQFTDTDIAQAAMRSSELRDALRNASPEAYDDIEEKLLNHTLRLQQLGTRQGQALAARNLAVLEDYSYDGAYRRIAGAMKARNVNDVSRETREKVKTITTELETATAKRDQLKKSLNAERAKIAEKVVTGETRKRRRATSSDLERREELLKKIQANRAKYISSVPAQWLFDSADDIKELARIQIMMGADKLDDVRAAVVAQLRASGMDIDDGEFDAVLAGEFNNKMARGQISEYQRLVAEAKAARKASDEGRIKAAEDRMRLLEQSIQDRIDRQLSRTKAGRDLIDAEKAVNVRKIEIDQMVRAARDQRRYEELSPGMKALAQVTGATRGLVLGADLGSLTNQGAFALLTRPVSALRAAGSGLKAARGEKALVNELAKIRSNKRFNAAVNAGLDIKSVLGDGRNEFYVSDAINKLPGYKQGQLFFDAQLAALRMNAFNSYVDSLTRMKLRTGGGKITDDEYKMIAEMVNTTTGSGTGELATRLKAVNQKYGVLLAPGFRLSRIKAALGTPILNAVKNKNYKLARILLGDYLRFLGGVAGMAAGIKMAGGDVETDPRSTDFMRFRKGNVNVSLASGLEDPLKKIVQAMTGSIKSREEGDEPSKPNKSKVGVNSFIDWFTQSLSPFYSSASMLAEQGVQRAIAEPGEELTFKKFGKNVDLMDREGQINIAKSQLPLWMQSSWDLFEDSELDDTQKLYLSLASALGVRVNVKPPKESK